MVDEERDESQQVTMIDEQPNRALKPSKDKTEVAYSHGGDESLLLQGSDDDYYDDGDDGYYEDDYDQEESVSAPSSTLESQDPDSTSKRTSTLASTSVQMPWAKAIGANYEDDAPYADAKQSPVRDVLESAYPDADESGSEAYSTSLSADDDEAADADAAAATSTLENSSAPAAAADASASTSDADTDADASSAADAEESEGDGITFKDLELSPAVLSAIKHEGFEQPTPIQLRAIPTILSGRDMIGQAQTGTGKTAAFALPILSRLPKTQRQIFALVLEPTRELALQVAESFSRFAHFIDNFRVAPIYGGASYENQIRSLRHGAQVVVATPGRLIDLIEKGRLDLTDVHYVVIDEADEMLRMGFIEDVDWILSKIPQQHQTALFSATMPPAIRRIAHEHLVDPLEVRIQSHTTTATTVRQRYWVVSGVHKIDAMTRMLEVEPYDAVLVFVRTKTDAEDVANKLAGRGLACAALHGDIPQRQREKIIERLKNGSLDIIIATDVAARGLDVDRITHVFNYDIPYDAESYVHRIGRTGRAGRPGEAILFVSPRERRALRQIERVTHQRIEPMRMPTIADVNKRRLENFRNQIIETIDAGGLGEYLEVVSDILSDDSIEPELLAAALAKMAQRDGSLLLDESAPEPKMRSLDERFERPERPERRHGGPSAEAVPLRAFPDIKMVRYRLAVGRRDSVKPGQIVGAIANEANIDSKYIGEISIYDSFSTVDLPVGMPRETMNVLARARVCGRALDLRVYTQDPPPRRHRSERFDRPERPERPSSERSERGDRFERRRFDRPERPERPERFERFPREDAPAVAGAPSEDDLFSYMDDGEYRHEKGDVNGNSIDYQPRRKAADEYAVGVGYGYDAAYDKGIFSDGAFDEQQSRYMPHSRRARPNFDTSRRERSARSAGRSSRPRPRFR